MTIVINFFWWVWNTFMLHGLDSSPCSKTTGLEFLFRCISTSLKSGINCYMFTAGPSQGLNVRAWTYLKTPLRLPEFFPIWQIFNDFENQNFEMFKEVVHNFDKSNGDIIYWKCLFPLDAYMVSCSTWSKISDGI